MTAEKEKIEKIMIRRTSKLDSNLRAKLKTLDKKIENNSKEMYERTWNSDKESDSASSQSSKSSKDSDIASVSDVFSASASRKSENTTSAYNNSQLQGASSSTGFNKNTEKKKSLKTVSFVIAESKSSERSTDRKEFADL